ncbi:MAG: type II toxin-antitoxin system Phd/YefM family antitoxin [Alphaproteobacteria bacterium]
MNHRVGATEAKKKLPELLRGVQSGKRYTITHRGRAVAELVPAEEAKRPEPAAAAAAVEAMKRFMARRRPVRGVDIKALIEYGRK